MKLAVIGLGPHGLRLLQSARRIEHIEIVAVIDRDSSKFLLPDVANVPRQLNNLNDLWRLEPSLDILLIATNGPSHASIALEALDNNVKHILVTKPFACTLNDAWAVYEAANKKRARVVVDHGLRHDDTYLFLEENIRSGKWGKLRSIYIQRPGIGLGCLGVHSFDLANQLFGQTPSRVTCWMDELIGKNPRGAEFVDPGGLVIMEYADNCRAIILQIEDGNGPMSVEINCQFAKIRVDEKFRLLEIVEKDKNAIPGPGRPVPITKTDNPLGTPPSHNIFDLMEKLIRELVNEDVNLRAEAIHGIKSLEVLVAAYHSHALGNIPVQLPLTDEAQLTLFLPIT